MSNTNGETVGELRENVPLRTGSKQNSWLKVFSCSEDGLGGSKLITVSFAILTIGITIALVAQIYLGDHQIVPHGSVATDFKECSAIGVDILKKGGNSVDAAVASALCLAVVNQHSTGLDAGGIFMLYSHRTRDPPLVIDFSNGPSAKLDDISMPTLVLSLVNIHLNYGRLSWKDVVTPSAQLASQGFLVASTLAKAIERAQVSNIYGQIQAGHNITQIKLSHYLYHLASIPADRLQKFLSTKHELNRNTAIKHSFNKYNIYVPNSPSGGPLLLMSLTHLSEVNFTNIDSSETQFRVAKVMLEMYEQLNVTNDNFRQGTSSNIAVIDNDDIYVSLITGMNDFFGSKILSADGYLLDMRDTYQNTRIPIIITDRKHTCGRRIVMGSGDIYTALQVIFSLIVSGEDATKSVEQPRFQIIDNNDIGVEEVPSKENVDWNFFIHKLESIANIRALPEPYGSVNIVEKTADELYSHSDKRGDGIAYRF